MNTLPRQLFLMLILITPVSMLGCATPSEPTSQEPVILSLPFSSHQQAQALDGKRVTFNQPLTVIDSYNLHRFGELTLAGERLYSPTNLHRPGSALAEQQEQLNRLNAVQLDDFSDQQYVEPIRYPNGGLTAANTVRVGDRVTSVTGILQVSDEAYRLHPSAPPHFVSVNKRSKTPELKDGDIRVASLNVLNLFNGDGKGGAFPTPRGADNPAEYQRQMDKLITAILTMDADIIGLMELENDGFGELSAIAQLTDALNQASGKTRYRFVDVGQPLGDDDIAVGLLYRPQVISAVSAPMINQSEIFDRPPLAQTFHHRPSDQRFTLAVNHFKSKGSCHKAQGRDQNQGDGQGCFNAKRVAQANTLVDWLTNEPGLNAGGQMLVIGDLNALAKEDPIHAMTERGFVDLVGQFTGNRGYSYVYRGQSGYIDHALASPELSTKVVDTAIWHINADEPRALDYNTEHKSPGQRQSLYAPDSYRVSDHDPVLVSIKFD